MRNQAVSISAEQTQRRQWRVTGRVQGVGFRPFIHRIARARRLSGFVLNDGGGVIIEAQGSPAELDGFASEIETAKPKLAIINDLSAVLVPTQVGEEDFAIRQSHADRQPRAEITPDLAVCPECLKELRDREDKRRHGYGLVNCTACGPRFSIIRKVPYDRPNTTMAAFEMCTDCRREYDDPADRRFHAQPTACHKCGPKVELVDPHGKRIDGDAIAQAAERLASGQIVAIKGIGGFHLAAAANNEQAVGRLRANKHRAYKPFALMVASAADAGKIASLGERGLELLESPAAPIVLAPRLADAPVAASVAPGNHRLGVMLAYTPIHHLIFDALHGRCPALVMTSANDSDEPLIFTNEDAVSHLGEMCDAILWHERPIERPVDDSVVLDAGTQHPIFLRRSRGFAPTPLKLPRPCKSTGICVGGELKNTVAVVRDGEVVLSQHLGDLDHARTYANFKRAVSDLTELLAVKPQWVAHDLHPTYVSTMFAKQLAASLNVRRMKFQHHHAHAAGVLAEHGQTGPALAVVCDGTGYGADGTIWGGELLAADLHGFKRLGHLRPMWLPGGDAASKDNWRCAMALLLNAFGDNFIDLPIVQQIAPDADKSNFVAQMLKTRTNCVASSAAGRVFDGVASLLGLASHNHFEAQAPMALESSAAAFGEAPPLQQPLFEIQDGDSIVIDFAPLVQVLATQRGNGTPAEELAAVFHDQFAAAWEAAVVRAVEKTGLICVALSGGVFCNQIVDRLLTDRLTRRGLHVLRHRNVPPNDGGLAFGQAALAAYRAAHETR